MGRDNRDDRNKIKRRKVSSSDRKPTTQILRVIPVDLEAKRKFLIKKDLEDLKV